MKAPSRLAGEVVDLFCGIGGLSYGLKLAGFDIKAGYDVDRRCKYAYESNNDASFLEADVANLSANEVKKHYSGKLPSILAGCAPCQPFSTYKRRYGEDPRWNLVDKFAKLAVQVHPDYITMENVPSLIKYKKGTIFSSFVNKLKDAGYNVFWTVAKCEEYGVPQKRRRLVLIASLKKHIDSLIPKTKACKTVRNAIGSLPPLDAGKCSSDDPLHVAAGLSNTNMQRIRSSKPGGTWRDWPKDLRAKCHQKNTGKSYTGVYARMSWDEPSPTITTQCYGFGNGRFGHPSQDRAISLREAAILQSFPSDYKFLPIGAKPSITEIGRWIGNAVPVALAEAIGKTIINSTDGE